LNDIIFEKILFLHFGEVAEFRSGCSTDHWSIITAKAPECAKQKANNL
jgi:hypothetical protein